MPAAKDWIDALLVRHGIDGTDARPLYAYRCDEADFAALARLTGPTLRSAISEGQPRRLPGALFCLFASEWIRRCYSGGQLRYADILAAAHAPTLPHPVLQDLVQRGLRFWGRPLLRVGQARIFLLTLACEGGLPMQFLRREGAAVRRYFRALLRDVCTYRQAGLSSVALASQASSYLPKSLRQDVVYALAAQIADAVWALQPRVSGDTDPIARLDQIAPTWRDSFPLELSDHTARSFLEGLVSDAVDIGRTGHDGFQVLRSLRHSAQGWELRAQIDLPGFLDHQQAAALFGADVTGRLELRLHSNGSESSVIGWATAGPTGVMIERANRLCEHKGSAARGALIVKARGQGADQRPLPTQGGEALEDLPWIFVASDDAGGALTFRGQGSIRTRYPAAWIAVPQGAELTPEGDTELEDAGTIIDLDRRVVRVVGQVRVTNADEMQCRVATRADQADEVSYRVEGKPLPLARASVPQYLGVPRVWGIAPEGLPRAVPDHQLRWRELGVGRAWRPFNRDCRGDGELRCIDNGELRFRTRIGLLPEGFTIKYEPGLTHTGGRLRVSCPAGTVGVRDAPAGITWQAIESPDAKDALIDVRSTGEAPESLTLGIRWPHGGENRLSIPFPAGGPRFLAPSGRVLGHAESIPHDRLSGVRARVIAPTASGRYVVTGTLRADDLTPELAHAVWLRAPLPRAQGFGGRIAELNLLELEDDIATMLSASQSLDAVVELRIEGPGFNDARNFVRVGRYDLSLEPTAERRGVRLEQASLARTDETSLTRLRVEMFPLWAPDRGPLELHQSDSEGVPTGEWSFAGLSPSPGPWMVVARDGDWVRTRPLLMTVGDDAPCSDDPVDTTEALAGRDLAGAIRLADREDRGTALSRTVEVLRDDCLSSDWDLVLALIHAFSDLPPSALDLLPRLAGEPEAAVITLLKENPAAVPNLLAAFEGLPFSWRLVPVRAWLHAVRRFATGLRGQLRDLDDCDALIWEVIRSVLGKASEHYPYFDVLRELIDWHVHGWLRQGEAQMLALASTPAGRAALEGCLAQSHQELLRNHGEDEKWPQGPELTQWLENQMREHAEVRAWIPDTPPGTGFRKPVQNAPIAAAMVSVYGLEAPPRMIFEISSLRTFDKRWFDEAHRLALTLMLGYRLEHCPLCWEA